MEHAIKSVRPFIGAESFGISRRFYTDLGFQESILSPKLSLFRVGDFGFYLQDAYVRDWIANMMIFLEVTDVEHYWRQLTGSGLTTSYPGVRLVPIKTHEWGKECFLHDPSGVLWHIGEFAK